MGHYKKNKHFVQKRTSQAFMNLERAKFQLDEVREKFAPYHQDYTDWLVAIMATIQAVQENLVKFSESAWDSGEEYLRKWWKE